METVYPRTLAKTLIPLLQRKEIIGIRGARQTGKSTLMKLLQQEIKGNSVFVNMDLPENRRALEEAPLDFVNRWKKEGQKLYLFLDEIQTVKNAGEQLKIIYDQEPDVKMIISGSSSLELKTKVLPALVGRLLLFELYTFDFGEFLYAKKPDLWKIYQQKKKSVEDYLNGKTEIEKPSFEQEFVTLWKEYAIFGGYPEVVKSSRAEEQQLILKNITTLYLEKDIAGFFKIEESSKFEDFVKSISFITSNLLILSSLASKIKLPLHQAEEFLNILQHTYIINLIKPYHKNLITEIKKSPKSYFLDLGMRNAILHNFSALDNRTDAGQILENAVFRQLLSSTEYQLYFWRTAGKAEVDFVLVKDMKVIPIEVKMSEKTVGKSFYSFLEAYSPEKAIIVTLDTFAVQKIKQTTVYWIPIFYL